MAGCTGQGTAFQENSRVDPRPIINCKSFEIEDNAVGHASVSDQG
jgi:hypothetical protein